MFNNCLRSFLKQRRPTNGFFQFKNFNRFSSLTREVLKVKMDLYEAQGGVKQFIVNQNQTLKNIEELLKEDNPNIKSIKFFIGDKEAQNMDDLSFLNLSLNNNLKLVIDNAQTTYNFDEQLNTANYFEETKLEGELAQYEVPFQDAQIIQAFIKNYKQILEKQNPSAQAFTEKQLNDGLNKAIETFSEFNYTNNYEKNTKLLESLRQSYHEEKSNVEKVEGDAQSKAASVVKRLLVLQVAQFGFLFYLTYGLYGWDFAEPVSYILGLGTEAIILYYFIKYRQGLNSSLLYSKRFDPVKNKLLSQYYSNAGNHLKFLKNKVDMTESKISFGRSKDK